MEFDEKTAHDNAAHSVKTMKARKTSKAQNLQRLILRRPSHKPDTPDQRHGTLNQYRGTSPHDSPMPRNLPLLIQQSTRPWFNTLASCAAKVLASFAPSASTSLPSLPFVPHFPPCSCNSRPFSSSAPDSFSALTQFAGFYFCRIAKN